MTGCCYDNNNNKLVLLCYLSIIFRNSLLLLSAIATLVFFFFLLVILDCQGGLSCVPLVFFMIFSPFLILKTIINVFYTLYLLVIKPLNLLWKYSLFMLGSALDGVLCSGQTAQKKYLSCLFQIEWYHLIVNVVAKCVFKSNKTVFQIL